MTTDQDDDIAAAARVLAAAHHVLVLTGAGVSAESGIPTFRDALTGLWSNFDAEELATPEGFLRDPPLVWGWYQWRRNQVLETRPNPGHFAIAALTALVPRLTLVTQNVDDLHERAGSRDVHHLHGGILTARCFDCARPYPLPPGPVPMTHDGMRLEPPRCARCGGLARPVDDCHTCPLGRHRACDGSSDPRSGAGHRRPLPLKPHPFPPWCRWCWSSRVCRRAAPRRSARPTRCVP